MSSQKKPKAIAENVTHVSPLHMYARNSHNSSINHSVASLWQTHIQIPTSASTGCSSFAAVIPNPKPPISSHRPYFPFSGPEPSNTDGMNFLFPHSCWITLLLPVHCDQGKTLTRPNYASGSLSFWLTFGHLLSHNFSFLENLKWLPCIGWRPPTGHMSTLLCR